MKKKNQLLGSTLLLVSTTLGLTGAENAHTDTTKMAMVKQKSQSKSILIHPKDTTVLKGKYIELKWKNNNASKTYLRVSYQDYGSTQFLYNNFVTKTNQSVLIPFEAKENLKVTLYSRVNNQWKTDTMMLKVKEGNVATTTKSTLISLNNKTVSVGDDVILEWENHGAKKEYLYVYYMVNSHRKRIYSGYVNDVRQAIQIPQDAKNSISISLYSQVYSRWKTDHQVLKVETINNVKKATFDFPKYKNGDDQHSIFKSIDKAYDATVYMPSNPLLKWKKNHASELHLEMVYYHDSKKIKTLFNAKVLGNSHILPITNGYDYEHYGASYKEYILLTLKSKVGNKWYTETKKLKVWMPW